MSKYQPVDRSGWMTTREVVIELGMSEHAVRTAFNRGDLTGYVLPSGYRRYSRESVASLKARMRQG